jgi:formate dehydrogenase
VERLLVLSGRTLRWKDIMARPHGWIYATKEYGNLSKIIRTPGHVVHLDDAELMDNLRAALATDAAPPDAARPFQLISRRRRDSMNSWLSEVPGLHKHHRSNAVELNEQDAARAGISDADLVRVFSATDSLIFPAEVSTAVRPGVVVIEHGWGSLVGDPRTGDVGESYGANRNRLVPNGDIDPLSQAPALNGAWVGVELAVVASASPRPATAAYAGPWPGVGSEAHPSA